MIHDERGKGIAAMLLAGSIWGLSPIFYKQLTHIPALEVASHRVLWSFLIFSAILVFSNRLGELFAIFAGNRRNLVQTLLAAAMISVNWTVWILAVQLGFTTEASLGYFMFPLFAVFLGMLVFREKLSWMQWTAVATATAGVVVLTVGLQAAPWIALVLASSFSVYGMLKKRAITGPLVSVSAEACIISPFALVWLFGVHALDWTGIMGQTGGYFGTDLKDSVMLAVSGILTASPLVLMSYSTKRLTYAEVGLLQYVNPTLQFLVAIFIFVEPFGSVHLVAFSMIWFALVLYSFDLVRQQRWLRRTRMASVGVETMVNSPNESTSANPAMTTLSKNSSRPLQ